MRYILYIPALLLAAGVAFAEASDVASPPRSSLERRLFADAADGRLDELTPLEAALVASGVEDAASLRRYERKASALVERLRASGELVGPPRRRAEAIFDFMHGQVLVGGYDLKHTDLRRVFDEGQYNCVTATVLYNYLAGQSGFDSQGLQMPGHAMSQLMLADGPLDVETTCPRWFQLADAPERRKAAVSRSIGSAATADRSKARRVTPIQLAAMIYYNRGVDLLAEKHFAEAVAANVKALRLDPQNAAVRGNLLAAINNWSIELGNQEYYAEAVELLRQGLAMDPTFEAFAQNYVHVHRQWVESLCHKEHYEEALEIIARATSEMPRHDCLVRMQDEVCRRWSKSISAAPCVHSHQVPCAVCPSPLE
ncbi:MAG: hypothetical protein JW959_10840 [Pirellulales bacterium]|nr:hypothetical protein [Pirellulales bacterium]